jgi:NAD(P)-dependent dehydrogenase (short-subunit alcohol dehydrogenase family)
LLRRRSFSFRGRVALVTGGSRGLGFLLARELGRRGARIALCARDGAELARARDALVREGIDVFTYACDLAQPAQAHAVVARVRERFGRLDVLVNNAGVIQVGPMESMRDNDFAESMSVHFWAPLHTTLAALPALRAAGDGRVVNISSIGGKVSVPHLLPYSAGKFALTGLSRGLRSELGRSNVKVTTVFPGLMRTGSPRNADFKGQHRKEYAWFSIADSLPGITMNAERAARKILDASERGDAELTLTVAAKALSTVSALLPRVTAAVLSLTARLLPGPGGAGTRRFKGYDSQSPLAPSLLTALGDRAALAYNERV